MHSSAPLKEFPDPDDFVFRAYRHCLPDIERAGPPRRSIMTLIRLLQAQAKCIRLVLVVEAEPLGATLSTWLAPHIRQQKTGNGFIKTSCYAS
jgi:hypothetical protein